MSQKKKSSVVLALGSMVVGIAATPVLVMFSTVAGIAMYTASMYMIYQAS